MTRSSSTVEGGSRRRLDPAAVRRTLREAGLHPRHALSQNFLADPDVLQAILDEAAARPGRRILEIGPGLGILTGGLLDDGAAVTAVELDRGLVARLRSVHAEGRAAGQDEATSPSGTLRIVEGDILDQAIPALIAPPFDVVANLPYHITSPVLHRLLGAAPRPERLVLMVQREVAERIAAPPGRMSYLSVFVQYHAAVRIAFVVPRDAFEPSPAVDSAVIVLEPYSPGRPDAPLGDGSAENARPRPFEALDPAEEDDLWRLVQAAFRERRKMLHNVLVRQLPVLAPTVERALAEAGIAGDRRPQTLSVPEWLALRRSLGPLPGDMRGRKAPSRTQAGTPDDADLDVPAGPGAENDGAEDG